jgi:capsule polysaccharide export protein KpsE/RkpR
VPAGQPGTVQEKIRVLQRQIVDLETEQVTLRQKLNPSHPKVLDVMTRLDRLKKELASLTGEAP